jgi:iron-sulfur cluster assembly accessory protein
MAIITEERDLQLTDAACLYIEKSLENASQGKAIGMRIGIKKAGCSGYEYVLEYVYDDLDSNNIDFIFNINQKFKIVIDKEIYLKFLKGGTVIDFVKENLKQGLKFNNPNVSAECGCGESFHLKSEVSGK